MGQSLFLRGWQWKGPGGGGGDHEVGFGPAEFEGEGPGFLALCIWSSQRGFWEDSSMSRLQKHGFR